MTYDKPQPVRYTATMAILIGMDEAGYGPNLGPLVVAATAWDVDEDAGCGGQGAGKERLRVAGCGLRIETAHPQSAIRNPKSEVSALSYDLYRSLRGVVSRTASERKIAIADSKVLYKPGQGLRQLERSVHSVLRAMQQSFGCWREIVAGCGGDPEGHHRRLPWHDGFDCRLPVDAADEELGRLGVRLRHSCDGAGVRPLAVRARLVFPAEFNELCEDFGSKGAALSHVTIALLREVVEALRSKKGTGTDRFGGGENSMEQSIEASSLFALPDSQSPVSSPQPPIFALCDKHGARNRYVGLLQHHFSEHWIEPILEGHTESRYEWGPPESRVHVAFRMQGEAFLPTALASMTAKYLRELAMRAFNEFWCARVPGLRPTAGYPGDAPRFKQAIAAAQRELDVADHLVWRNR